MDRKAIAQALAKAQAYNQAYKQCGEEAKARAWAARLVDLLECADILAPGTVIAR